MIKALRDFFDPDDLGLRNMRRTWAVLIAGVLVAALFTVPPTMRHKTKMFAANFGIDLTLPKPR